MKDFLAAFISQLLILILQGELISVCWNFIIPLFWHNAPTLTFFHGFALAAFAGFVFPNNVLNK